MSILDDYPHDMYDLAAIVTQTAEFRVGQYVVTRYRAAAQERGHGPVAAQLRKQGWPIEQTLVLLGFRPRKEAP